MKKTYLKPEGKVVTMSIQENIASSMSMTNDAYGIAYTFGADGTTKYIMGSSVEATNTNNENFNRFYDLVKSFLYAELVPANCRVSAD